MKIIRHRLHADDGKPFPYQSSPNRGGKIDPKYLVMHATASSSADSAIRQLRSPLSNASAHLVIARNGAITQLVPFDRVAWHAGRSRWQNLVGLNQYSIGIEIDNAGELQRKGGTWRAWFGTIYPDDQVMEAIHKHSTITRGWHLYTEEQLQAVIEVSQLLVTSYELIDVLGHDDIAPGRKTDPGPAFPMDHVRAAVMGRQEDVIEEFETTVDVNIRFGPGTEYEKLDISPLKAKTGLRLHMRQSTWYYVDVLDKKGHPTDSGWVHGDYIRPAK